MVQSYNDGWLSRSLVGRTRSAAANLLRRRGNDLTSGVPAANWQDRGCSRCAALSASRTQVVIATPCPPGGLLAIGEAPGADEDAQGEGFVGTAGKTLDQLLGAEGLVRDAYGRTNICRCRPPENRKPTGAEISACLPFLASLILAVRPKVILAVGATPTSVLCGAGTLYDKIQVRQSDQDWRATINERAPHKDVRHALEFVTYVVPMPHTSPLALNRNAPSGEKWRQIASRQVALAARLLRQ